MNLATRIVLANVDATHAMLLTYLQETYALYLELSTLAHAEPDPDDGWTHGYLTGAADVARRSTQHTAAILSVSMENFQ